MHGYCVWVYPFHCASMPLIVYLIFVPFLILAFLSVCRLTVGMFIFAFVGHVYPCKFSPCALILHAVMRKYRVVVEEKVCVCESKIQSKIQNGRFIHVLALHLRRNLGSKPCILRFCILRFRIFLVCCTLFVPCYCIPLTLLPPNQRASFSCHLDHVRRPQSMAGRPDNSAIALN